MVLSLFAVSRIFRRGDCRGTDRHLDRCSISRCSRRRRRDRWSLRTRCRRLNVAGNFRVRSSPDQRASRRRRQHHSSNTVGASVAFFSVCADTDTTVRITALTVDSTVFGAESSAPYNIDAATTEPDDTCIIAIVAVGAGFFDIHGTAFEHRCYHA